MSTYPTKSENALSSDESLESLGKKLKALAKVNDDILSEIEAKTHLEVIKGYQYKLDLESNHDESTHGGKQGGVRHL